MVVKRIISIAVRKNYYKLIARLSFVVMIQC